MKNKRHVPIIKQLTQTECGLCCCVMILRYYKSNESLKELQDYMDVGRDGLSISQIKNLFELKGFKGRIFKVEKAEALCSITKPFIAYWKKSHYVVVEKFKKNKFYIKDPAEGTKVISLEEFEKDFSNIIIVAEVTENYKPQKKKKYKPWKDAFASLLEHKLLIFQLLPLLIVTYILTLQIPILIQKIVDKTMVSTNMSYLNIFLLVIFIAIGLFLVSTLVKGVKLISLNIILGRSLEADTYKHLLKLNYKFFEMRSTGDLLFRLSSTSAVKELLSSQIISGILDIGTIIVIFVYMLKQSVLLTFAALVVFILNLIFMLIVQPIFTQAMNDELTEKSKSQALQVEALYSISSIKIACIEDDVYAIWKDCYERVIKMVKKRMNINNYSGSITSTIQQFVPIIILIIGISEYFKGIMSIGEVIAFETIVSTFFALSTSIFNNYTQYLLASEYLERVTDIWYSKEDEEGENIVEKKISGCIKLDNISFSYSKNSPKVLKNISLDIEAGKKIAFVGASGSGKSTLSKIIIGLYESTEGELLYDNIPFKMYNKKKLCSQMGIVPQDAMLFNKSIYDNIVMNKKNLSLEEVKKVAKIARIDEEIELMPMAYNTIVSEMGMNLSGGQRQRILLARALINKPKILVLDEATSSLDNINEEAISEYLSKQGCTRIIISHRLSTIIDSDIIYVFSEGEIVESDTHYNLMKKKQGIYCKLYTSGIKVQV
ncbi:peptidase domain-containing ABC transporter [Clostridium estertheticum]|uniref:peptidase domain-containing ABC transporter n=1 Tax=Clostridium estertheticum TaxID=238834 RepID=UPI001CF5F3E0|nr:peptidase domain-containing ABC transporter [Clostridium estertheticum]MCB2356542.1 peptidase domain-containing ABC transporter [Clostridium estertheticum]WAG43627.1 peptidase domain-containing ABC transporter [Clostridium estertheticum]